MSGPVILEDAAQTVNPVIPSGCRMVLGSHRRCGVLARDRKGQNHIRLSPHFYNTDAELHRTLELLYTRPIHPLAAHKKSRIRRNALTFQNAQP